MDRLKKVQQFLEEQEIPKKYRTSDAEAALDVLMWTKLFPPFLGYEIGKAYGDVAAEDIEKDLEKEREDDLMVSNIQRKIEYAKDPRTREVYHDTSLIGQSRQDADEMMKRAEDRLKKSKPKAKPSTLFTFVPEQYTEQQMNLFDTHPHRANELANQFNIQAANEHPTVQHAHIHGNQSVKSGTLEAIRRYTQGEGSITRSIKDAIARVARKETGWSAQDPEPTTASPEQLSTLKRTVDARRTQRAANQMFASLGGTPEKELDQLDPEKEAARKRIREILQARGSSINLG